MFIKILAWDELNAIQYAYSLIADIQKCKSLSFGHYHQLRYHQISIESFKMNSQELNQINKQSDCVQIRCREQNDFISKSNIGIPLIASFSEDQEIDEDLLLSRIEHQSYSTPPSCLDNYDIPLHSNDLLKSTNPQHKLNHRLMRADSNEQPKKYCGCGQSYSCTSSLYLHIRTKHHGVAPEGTIGGPKGIIKKRFRNHSDIGVKLEEGIDPRRAIASKIKTISQSKNKQSQPNKNSLEGAVEEIIDKKMNQNVMASSKKRTCELCSKQYSCNSALKLHLRKKHHLMLETRKKNQPLHPPKKVDESILENNNLQTKVRRNQTNRKYSKQIIPLPIEKCSLICEQCNESFDLKEDLLEHINIIHRHTQSLKRNRKVQNITCGCGAKYQSKSALNVHAKKKHQGDYPQGTTINGIESHKSYNSQSQGTYNQAPHSRSTIRGRPEVEAKRRSSNGKQSNPRIDEEDSQQSIYDSQSDDQPIEEAKVANRKRVIDKDIIERLHQEQAELEDLRLNDSRKFKCGCGRLYANSSSLNVHIRNSHNWIPPEGTIGGPMGLKPPPRSESPHPRPENQSKVSIHRFKCTDCQITLPQEGYYECQSCQSHKVCQKCFWSQKKGFQQHEWIIKRKKP